MVGKRLAHKSALSISVAAATLFVAAPVNAQSSEKSPDSGNIGDSSDIIVTATKRPEAVRSISGSVSALSGDQLDKLGADSMADFLSRTPGVVINSGNPGGSTVIIRGVSTTTGGNQSQNTTGLFLNDIPLTDPSFSIGEPDIDTFDVDNVSILRGPQGTLFGSATMGGAVNYQATRPDLLDWQARLQGTVQATEHGKAGGAAKVMINAPLFSDKFAIRGVFSYRNDAGFIDNVGTGQRDVNRTRTKSGRILATWRPGPNTTISYLHLQQSQKTDDLGVESLGLGLSRLQKSTPIAESVQFDTLVHNVRIDQDVSFATLVATATYHQKTTNSVTDLSALGPVLEGALGVPFSPILSFGPGRSEGETFEVRMVSAPGGRLDYVIGAFYDQTRVNLSQVITAGGLASFVDVFGPALGLPAGQGQTIAPNDLLIDAALPAQSKELAFFGEASYRFSDQFKVTLGGRLFDQKFSNGSDANGLFVLFLGGGGLTSSQSGTQHASGFNPKFSVTWTPNKDLMFYTLASKGYRFGGANLSVLPGVDPTYGSDSLWNYEAGMRADLFDRKLLLDLTGFYIDWSNIQLSRQISGVNFIANAGTARIYGLEASATLRPVQGLSLTSNLTYLNAKLSTDYDSDPSDPGNVIVPKGTRLPGAYEWQMSNTLKYDFDLGSLRPSAVLSHRYVSQAANSVDAGSGLQGGYNVFDARLGMEQGRYGLTLFVNNLTDSKGVTASGNAPPTQYVLRPRTFGVTLDVKM